MHFAWFPPLISFLFNWGEMSYRKILCLGFNCSKNSEGEKISVGRSRLVRLYRVLQTVFLGSLNI